VDHSLPQLAHPESAARVDQLSADRARRPALSLPLAQNRLPGAMPARARADWSPPRPASLPQDASTGQVRQGCSGRAGLRRGGPARERVASGQLVRSLVLAHDLGADPAPPRHCQASLPRPRRPPDSGSRPALFPESDLAPAAGCRGRYGRPSRRRPAPTAGARGAGTAGRTGRACRGRLRPGGADRGRVCRTGREHPPSAVIVFLCSCGEPRHGICLGSAFPQVRWVMWSGAAALQHKCPPAASSLGVAVRCR